MNALSAGLAGALDKQTAPFFNLPLPIWSNFLIGPPTTTDRLEIHATLTLLFYPARSSPASASRISLTINAEG